MRSDAKLIVDLKVYGFEQRNIQFVYKLDTLENIDLLTYPFSNEKEFFEAKKSEILNKLNKELNVYGFQFPISTIELDEEISYPIFIVREAKKKQVLFQWIKVQNKEYLIEDLAKIRLLKNKAYHLFFCDEIASQDINYESIFAFCNKNIYMKIKTNLLKKEDIENFFEFLKTKRRYFSILRFILSSKELEELIEIYLETVPKKENKEERNSIRSREKSRVYQFPYKED